MANNLVKGRGVNDIKNSTFTIVSGKKIRCKIYQSWVGMLERSCCEKYKAKNPTYKDVTVCNEWLLYSKYKSWALKQDWQGKCLDKDIIKKGNRQYAPENCCFVSVAVNNMVANNRIDNDDLPPGVNWDGRIEKFVARCRDGHGKCAYLGSFDNPQDAEMEYNWFKYGIIKKAAEAEDDPRISQGLRDQAKFYYDNS